MNKIAPKLLDAAKEIETLRAEIAELRDRLNKEIERSHELEVLLDESGYRRRHQTESDGGQEEIRVENAGLALGISIESKQARGLEISVEAYEDGKIVIAPWENSTLLEAAKRAKATISHNWGFLRPELTRAEIVSILEGHLRWAHACLRPHPEKPGKAQGWG